jgi:hypothetical protein
LTIGFVGPLRHWGSTLQHLPLSSPFRQLHATGILARLGLLARVWLSPEGYPINEQKHLVRDLYHDGLRVFTFAFDSPSVEPGNTPYVQSQKDLDELFARCREFFDFFMGQLGGVPTTPLELKNQLAEPCTTVPEVR